MDSNIHEYELSEDVRVLYKIKNASYSHEFGIEFCKQIEIIEILCNIYLGDIPVSVTDEQLKRIEEKIYQDVLAA